MANEVNFLNGVVLGSPLAVTSGGTGAGSANAALNNLLPTQTGNNGKFLTTDGAGNPSWSTVAASGLTLKTNGANNGSQTTLNLVGSGVTISENGSGTVTITGASGGISSESEDSSNHTIVIGSQATISSTGNSRIVIGRAEAASGTFGADYQIAIGAGNGGFNGARDAYAIAIGASALAQNYQSIAIGAGAKAKANYAAVVTGYGASASEATGAGAHVFGSAGGSAQGNFSGVYGGIGCTTYGYNSSSIGGENLVANGYRQTVIGANNALLPSSANTTSYTATDPLLIVGNGTGIGSRSNCFYVTGDGRIFVGNTAQTQITNTSGKLLHAAIEQNSANTNDVLKWNGSAWVPGAVSVAPWYTVNSITANSTAAAGNSYIVSGGSAVDVTLPASPSIGDRVLVIRNQSTGDVTVKNGAAASSIYFDNEANNTPGTSGYVRLYGSNDYVELECIGVATGPKWRVIRSAGLVLSDDGVTRATTGNSTGIPGSNQSANLVFAGPTGGGSALPTFRSLVAADIPTLNQNTTGTAANVTGTVAIANGGTGQATQQAAINALAGAVTTGQFLRGNGTNVVMATIQASDVPTLNQNTTGTASNITGTAAIGNGGTGQTTQQAAIDALTGTQSSGTYLRSDGTHATLTAIQAADVPTLNQNTTGTAANVTGTVAIANGGTGATTATAARVNLGVRHTVSQASDQARINNASVTGSSLTTGQVLLHGTTYRFRLVVYFDTTAAGDFKYSMTELFGAGFTNIRFKQLTCVGGGTPAFAAIQTAWPNGVALTGTGTTGGYIELEGQFTAQASGGAGTNANLIFQFAQNTATNDTGAIVKAGSFLEWMAV